MRSLFAAACLIALGVVLAAGPAWGQQGDTPQKLTMEVSIVATGRDNAPVEDLTEKQITVKDNNRTQEIVSFVKLTTGSAAALDRPSLYNIVLIDCLNTTYRDLPENRVEMLKALYELTRADNLTLLMLRQGLRVLHDFGAEGQTVIRRLADQGLKGLDSRPPELAPYDWVFSDQLGLYQLFTPAGIFDRRRIEDSMGALRTIALNYQNRSGRKNLIWFSQGFPITIGHQPPGYEAQTLGGATPPASRAEDLSAYARDMDFTGRMLNNANIAVYPIDSRYLSVDDSKSSERSTMQDLANETGGLAFLSRRDVAQAVREALADTRTVYVLRYAISDLKYDGKFHAIKVETSRRDVKLRYRKGYYAPTAAPQKR